MTWCGVMCIGMLQKTLCDLLARGLRSFTSADRHWSIASWNEWLTVNGRSCSFCWWTCSPSGWLWCFRSLTFIWKKVSTYGFSYVCLICHATTNEPIAKLRDKLAKDSLQHTVPALPQPGDWKSCRLGDWKSCRFCTSILPALSISVAHNTMSGHVITGVCNMEY